LTVPDAPGRSGKKQGRSAAGKWQQTFWGRCLIGLLIAAGVYYVLLSLCAAVIAAALAEPARTDWWKSVPGLFVQQTMQAVGVLIGGMIAAAGQRRGLRYGLIVGVYNCFLFLILEVMIFNHPMTPLQLVSIPVVQSVFGALGGFLGTRIWGGMDPVTVAPAAPALPATSVAFRHPDHSKPLFAGPINWLHVGYGVAVMVLGVLMAAYILKQMIRSSEGRMTIESRNEARFFTAEISIFLVVIGGAFAGSNSKNGGKQGLVAAIFSSILLLTIYVPKGDVRLPAENLGFPMPMAFDLPSSDGPPRHFELPGSELLQNMICTIVSMILLGIMGGWFGSELLPPLAPIPPRKKQPYDDPR